MHDPQNQHKTISEMVRSDYRTADVLNKHGINYCCGGNITLAEACTARNIDPVILEEELAQATKTIHLPNSLPYEQWSIDFLIEYIINIHHAYLKQTLPVLEATLVSFVSSHQKQYRELTEVQQTFQTLLPLLSLHQQQEEDIIFPYIRQLANAYRRKESYGSLFVRTLRKPLGRLEAEFNRVGQLLEQLRSLTHYYIFPENACTRHRVVFQKLQEFDGDLVQHRHLESHYLFPKAIRLEEALLQERNP
ncbi:MAG: DUF542 domain-containing protein [Flavisolibacter sp.]